MIHSDFQIHFLVDTVEDIQGHRLYTDTDQPEQQSTDASIKSLDKTTYLLS